MASPGLDTNERNPPSDIPFILFCTIHKGKDGNPLPFRVLGERKAHKKIEGQWTDYIEPIYECPKCIFPEWKE